MKQYIDLVRDVVSSSKHRNTRSGLVHSVFDRNISFDLREGEPIMTTKKLYIRPMVGELLWMLNGETTIEDLRHRSDMDDGEWTIWSDDCTRWHSSERHGLDKDDLGDVYGSQWRGWTGSEHPHDQLAELVHSMKFNPTSRYMIVSAWNVADIAEDRMALPPCHMMFQVYVDDGEFDLKWTQRSVDLALGLPFNIASYGLLMRILESLTGLRARYLSASLGDVHIYASHLVDLFLQCNREPLESSTWHTPDINHLDDLSDLTAKDFKLVNYKHHAPVSYELSVG